MKALVLTEYNRFDYTDVPEPQIGPREVLVEVKACGICGSDVHGMDGSTGRRLPPIIMGHEAAGVDRRGRRRRSTVWPVGERVTFDSMISCGDCWFCRRGQVNLCNHRRVLGVSCTEFKQHGAFAEYVAVPQHIVCPLPEGLSFERAAMAEPVSVARACRRPAADPARRFGRGSRHGHDRAVGRAGAAAGRLRAGVRGRRRRPAAGTGPSARRR